MDAWPAFLHVSTGQSNLQVPEGRARLQALRDDRGADGPEPADAADAEVQQVRAEVEDGDEADGARRAEELELREAGALGERDDALEDDAPLGGAGQARVREPPGVAHAGGGGQAGDHAVDDAAQGLGGAAQGHGAVLEPELLPDVRGDGAQHVLEGLGVEHGAGIAVGGEMRGVASYMQR